jgi:pantoate--beta-alanine ligase
MKIFKNVADWQRFRAEQKRAQQETLGFVPTMGALHAGHLALVTRAGEENDATLVSIFVNPTQFNNKEDLEKYPRTVEADLALLEQSGCDYVLLPNYQQLYQDGYRYKVTESENSKILCGAHRPGHFDGVLTVVMKLLNIAAAENCYMGEKDYQQFMLVREMAQTFFMPTQIIPCATEREADGLALSSRNVRLSAAGREKAPLIYKVLNEARDTDEARTRLSAAGFEVEYVQEIWGRRFVAAHIDGVRLIDNVSK